MRWDDLKGKNVAVWGLGREGVSVLDRLLEYSPAHVTLVDDNREARETTAVKDFTAKCASQKILVTSIGEAVASHEIVPDSIIIKSPGISRYDDPIQGVLAKNCSITSSSDLWFSERNGEHVIGVTGSKGKSTTSALVTQIISDQGVDAKLGGNIGTPLVELPEEIEDGWCIAEISSFQAADLTASPEYGILTSLFPEHLDWHHGYDNYAKDKLNLFASKSNKAFFVDAMNSEVVARTESMANRVLVNSSDSIAWHDNETLYYDGQSLITSGELLLSGAHNLTNAALAIAAAHSALNGLDREKLQSTLKQFRGLPHRLQTIGELQGALVIDDGLATTAGACVAALEIFSDKRVAIFLGGFDRGVSYDPVAKILCERTLPLIGYLMGPAGEKINMAFESMGGNPNVYLQPVETLRIGIQAVAEIAQNVDVILLAPGGSSFNEFANYEERSDVFRDELLAKGMTVTA